MPIKTTTRMAHLLVVTGLLVVSSASIAHSDHEKSRFVASSGTDEGQCNNRFRPCQSISYAVRHANKGDVIKVAGGRYIIASSAEVLLLTSELTPIRGGYSTQDHFQYQSPTTNDTLLVGLPNSYRDVAYQNGFSLLADGKSHNSEALIEAEQIAQTLTSRQQETQCEDGIAGQFACSNIDLVAHLPLSDLPTNSNAANDIWGHVDLNTGKEYAIIGLRAGVAVVDISVPTQPAVVGSINGQPTTWRDIKVYQQFDRATSRWEAYAYVTADSASEGLVIIDLNDLDNGISIASQDRTDTRAHNVYLSGVDYSLNTTLPGTTPQMHILGANNFGGALRSYDLKRPEQPSPSYVPEELGRNDYTHDASSLLIDDVRAQQDCPKSRNGQCTVLIDFNEQSLRLWDGTQADEAVMLSDTGYTNSEYSHSGWWSEDKRYVLLHDELDEQRLSLNTTVHIFDISNLSNPVHMGAWVGPTEATDHNGFVRGNRYYMSNYERGLTVLDIANPVAPEEIGFFDTYPSSNNGSFNGAWGVYPFLPSGLILVSDIQRGLFILQDRTLADQDTIGFGQSVSASEGNTLQIPVSRQSNIGSASVRYSILYGSASANDLELDTLTGELNWASGDPQTQFISIPVVADQRDETDESVFVALHNVSGAYLDPQARMTEATIEGDALLRGIPTFIDSTISVRENQGSIEVSVARSGGSNGELTVDVSFVSTNALIDITVDTPEIRWTDQDMDNKTLVLTAVDDDLPEETEAFLLRMGEQEITVSIRDDETNQAPQVQAGANLSVNARANVTLRGTASDPEDGTLSLQWSQSNGGAVTLSDETSLQPQFTAPESATTLTFELTATDDFGVSSSDSVTVNVVEPQPQPAAPAPSSSGGGGSTGAGVLLLSLAIAIRRLKNKTPT